MTIRDAANNPLVVGFTGQVYTVSAPTDNGMYRPQFPVTTAANTSGGRGGTVYRINTLADNLDPPVAVGDGSFRCSLRRALSVQSAPKIIVFEISGYINNNDDPMQSRGDGVTVAGQTAPSPGICLQNEGVQILGPNQVWQHISSRPGNWGGPVIPQTSRRDAFLIYDALTSVQNIVLDHVTAGWAPGKNLNTFLNNSGDIALIWRSMSCEALYRASNVIVSPGEPSSLGLLLARSLIAKSYSVIETILAHNAARNPEVQEGNSVNFLNNLVYDWGSDLVEYNWAGLHYAPGGTPIPYLTNFVNGRYIAGPSTPKNFLPLYAAFAYSAWPGSQVYVTGNSLDQTLAAITEWDYNPAIGFDPRVGSPATPFPTGFVPIAGSAVQAQVLANSGARPLNRNAMDQRVINDITNRTGTVISNQNDVGGYATLAVNNRVFNMPSNPNGTSPIRGAPFTIIEDYLEQLARELEP